MIQYIIKRDGRKVPFDEGKITEAIFRAAKALDGQDEKMAKELSKKVKETLISNNILVPNVEEIQDTVEKILIDNGHAKTAKEYILYRADRTKVRDMNTKLMKIYEDLTFKEAVDNDLKRENANINGDTAMGTMLKYGSEGAKQFYDMFVLDPKHSKAHKDGDIHIHDMDFYTLTTTCCQIDIKKLFKDGFSTGHGYLREPNDIASYSALACIAIQANQNDQHGGQSIPNFDYAMEDGVIKTYVKRYKSNLAKVLDIQYELKNSEEIINNIFIEVTSKNDTNIKMRDLVYKEYSKKENVDYLKKTNYYKLERQALVLNTEISKEDILGIQEKALIYTEKEIIRSVYQAMEAFIHNLNTMHSRAGAQIPFSSINYGTCTSPEGRLVTYSVLKATEAGLGNGETPIFPIHIFKVKEGINYNREDLNYDLFRLACRVSAKRLFPNFSFIDAPFNLQYYREGEPLSECAYMGCRTRVIGNVYDNSRETVGGRGNLSFTSINLPRIALKSHGNLDVFFKELKIKMELCFDQLLARFKIQCQKKVKNYPFLMGEGIWMDSDKLGKDDVVGEVLKHGTLSVGFIGLAETLKCLIGYHHGESDEAQDLGLRIIKFMREITDEKSKNTGLNFSLLATPAEGLSGRFVRIDKKIYGKVDGVTDKDYYTNSFHIPVSYSISAFEKIQKEAPYHNLTNAGHISYVELDGDLNKNIDAFEDIVRAMKEAGIGYGSINHPVDRDPVCGYTGIIDNICPKCGRIEFNHDEGHERIPRILC